MRIEGLGASEIPKQMKIGRFSDYKILNEDAKRYSNSTQFRNSSEPQRQDIYLRALQWHCKEVEVHFGHFLTHKVQAPLANPGKGPRLVEVIKTEEKVSVSLKYD